MKRREENFTLVELMVVIAVICLLTALLLPALANAKKMAKSITCLSNQKQLGLALVNYADDHDGWMIVAQDSFAGHDSTEWKNQLASYLGVKNAPLYTRFPQANKPPFTCPSWLELSVVCPNYAYEGGLGWNIGVGYTTTIWHRKIQELSKLSETVFFQDTTSCPAVYGAPLVKPLSKWTVSSLLAVSSIHRKGLNTLWGDMHGSWDAQRLFIDGKTSPGYTGNAYDYFYWGSGNNGK